MHTPRKQPRAAVSLFAGASLLLLCPVISQQPAPAPAPQSSAAAQAQSPAPSGPPLVLNSAEQGSDATSIHEDEVRRQLQGKTFYLRRGYLGDALHFNESGALDGNAPAASYTLSLVEIERVHLEKHRLELECVRYGLHFLGALTTEDQTQAVDRVRLTTKKKPLKITIDRLAVSKPKKEKAPKHGKDRYVVAPGSATPAAQDTATAPAPGPAQPAVDAKHRRASAGSEALANIALAKALDNVFAPAIDQRMIAILPEYWSLFYQAAAAHQLYKPTDSSVLRQSDVDQKAKLVSMADPQSNEYAQKNGVAGMSMYSVVVGADGKPEQIAVGRPIGFGLDENAVAAIQKATFQPAMKNGHPVPVLLDVVVQFRIYSARTATESAAAARPANPPEPILPGPYTANMPRPPAQPVADTPQQRAPAAESAQPAAQPANPAAETQPAPSPSQQPANTPQPASTPQ
jgi:TonB family protein